MLLADGEGGRDGDVGHLVLGEDGAYEVLHRLHVVDPFAQIQVLDRTAGVQGLQFVLQVHALEDVVRVGHGQLGAVGVLWLVVAALDDVGVFLLVQPGQPVAGALGGGGLQVVAVARLLLELHHEISKEVHDLQREGQALLAADVLPQEVEAGFVHAHQADGVEVVVPVFTGPGLHVPEVVGGIGVQSPVRLVLDDLALDL